MGKNVETNDHPSEYPANLSPKEREKLRLEIENLRNKNKWEALTPVIPPIVSVVTVVVSAMALLIGFWEFNDLQEKTVREQRRERTTALEKQLRSDVDELSRFAQDKNQTLSRLSFLLDDMNILRGATTATELSAETFRSYEQSLTKALVEQILNDADFSSYSKHVGFATTIARNWGDYRNYLNKKENQDTLRRILYRYIRALRGLRNQNAPYFKALKYDTNIGYTLPAHLEKTKDEEQVFQHLLYILDGFKEHLGLISHDSEAQKIKKESIADFEDALCIRSIAQHVLGNDFVERPCMAR